MIASNWLLRYLHVYTLKKYLITNDYTLPSVTCIISNSLLNQLTKHCHYLFKMSENCTAPIPKTRQSKQQINTANKVTKE